MKGGNIDIYPTDLEFAVFSSKDIRRISVMKVITGLSFDAIGQALPGGLYDNLMGTFGRRVEPCHTCRKMQACPGHLGHIELDALVYNPFFIKVIQKILGIFCLNCSNIQIKDYVCDILILQLRLIDAGYIIEAQELEIYKSEIIFNNDENRVQLENGEYVHPRIAEIQKLFDQGCSNTYNNTKSNCAVRAGIVHAALQRQSATKCFRCQNPLRAIRYLNRKLVYYCTTKDLQNANTTSTSGHHKIILADECRKYLRKIYENCPDLLKLLFPVLKLSTDKDDNNSCPFDLFFMDIVPVTPPNSRPANLVNGSFLEHPQTALYRAIIENNTVLRVVMRHMKGERAGISAETEVYTAMKGATPHEKLYNAWQTLQGSVDLILDASTSKDAEGDQGLKQILEKKDGLLRKHMMGKRVNYAARTVITPDPYINVDEVGIPDIFARRLSYPVPVTPWNVSELRKMVINGPKKHPGANYIEDEKGFQTIIPEGNPAKRESMAKLLLSLPQHGMKIVHRHVLNGDILLLNRQPSLHKPSIMAHKARILPAEKTFRLHYSNCKAYNADFDGDEMNAHYPQNEVARAEAYNIVNVASNYLVPKDGTPLGGLIQDHIISGVKLSLRGRFFNREDYQQLVFQGLFHIRGDIKLLPPTILKPIALWSGKQILSTILINLIPEGYKRINLSTNTKISDKQWSVAPARTPPCGVIESTDHNFRDMSESKVIIHDGELLCGVLDKNQYGASTYGLIHCMYELYGGEISTRCLTAFTKLFTTFLQREGFTLGVNDILVTSKADSERHKIIKECRTIGNSAVAAALDLDSVPELDELTAQMEDAYIKQPSFRILLDRKYKAALDGYTNNINKACLPDGLITKFPSNNLQLMVLSGAKGSMVNTMQISCLLGQIELEGKRPPLMISGKSLPSFTSFETSPKSGGFIDGRFMTGIQPQDFFFHCMAGREGLIDTAVKTSRSGYLQRCLIKHLEGLTVNYDMTVRDSDNSVVQYLYGEDGLDVLKSKFFVGNFGPNFLSNSGSIILRPSELECIKDDETLSKVMRHTKKLHSWQKRHARSVSKGYQKMTAFTKFSVEVRDEINIPNPNGINPKNGRRNIDDSIIKLWRSADSDHKDHLIKKYASCPDPTTSLYRQDSCYGAVSEVVQKIIDDFKKTESKESGEKFSDIMYVKNMKALVTPGDPVGLLAAQSIGEPSTQMTLNTFHFAGRGEMNVTLGIPRLREILMLASSNIKTPNMDIPINPNQMKKADKLRIKLNRVTLADLLQFVNIKSRLVLDPLRAYQYKVHFQFLPRDAYDDDFCVRPRQILKYMTEKFFKQLFQAIMNIGKTKNAYIDETKAGKKATMNAEKAIDDEIDEIEEPVKDSKDKTTSTPEDAMDSSEDEQGDNDDENDATGIKLKSRKKDETEYDEPEDVEEIDDANEEADVEEVFGSGDEEADELQTIISDLKDNQMVEDYTYDKEHHLWCQLTFNVLTKHKKPDFSYLLRDLASKSVVHQVPNINRSIICKNDKDVVVLKTDGINVIEMTKYTDVLNLNGLYSNDIQAILKTYGVEAAAQVITKEISNVFKVYGITVDRRHLSLISDYMTFDGTFQPLSRKGMESNSSPLQQMSFETCMRFLTSATQYGHVDELNSPSSRVMVGLPIKNGTGAFELLTKLC